MRKRIGLAVGIFVLCLLTVLAVLQKCGKDAKDTEKFWERVISHCFADVDSDGCEELLTIETLVPGQVNEAGRLFGNYLRIYKRFTQAGPLGEADLSFDLSYVRPMFVQSGDVNRDGRAEISVIAYKETKFHPVPAMRPFFYALADGELEKVWLGSRLSRPFEDFVLFDADGDGYEELIAIERTRDNALVAAIYRWEGFGFDMESEAALSGGNAAFEGDRTRALEQVIVRTESGSFEIKTENGQLLALPVTE